MFFSVQTPARDSSPRSKLCPCVGRERRRTLSGKPSERKSLGPGWNTLVLSLFFLFPFPSLCGAEIFIEPRIGFHGVFQLGHPFPVEVELSNSGRPAEGTLEIAVWKGGATKGGAPYPLYYRRDIFLSPQSRKTVQLTVDPDFISRPLKITFSSPAGNASREIDLRRHFSPSPVVLLVSEGNTIPTVSLGSTLTNRLVALTLAELPPDPRALLGVSHLILYDQSLRDLSRSQFFALDTWLTAGGRMVILGSLNYSLYQEPTISRFLPVRVTGIKRVSFTPPADQSGRVSPIADVWAQASTVFGGKVLEASQGMPVLVEASRGKGRISYLSVDVGRPPLSQWDGLPKFLQNLLVPVGDDALVPRTRWDDAVFSQLILSPSFMSTYLPTASLFTAIVGYLTSIGLFSWLWQRQRFSRPTLTTAFFLLIVLSTGAGYLLFSRAGNIPDGVLLSANVMEGSADGYVEVQSNLALFSTQIRQYGLQMERGWMELVPVVASTRDRTEPAVVFQDGDGASRFELPLREWDYKLFRVRFVDRFPLRAEFEQEAGKLRMRLNNQSTKDLADCWLVVPGLRYPLGDIPRGSSWTKEFPLADGQGLERGSARADSLDFREIAFKDKTREILFHSSFFPRDEGSVRWSTGAAVFFGWLKEPIRQATVNDQRIRNYDYTLFRTIFPLAGPEDE